MEHKKYELSESLDRMSRIIDGDGQNYRRYAFIPDKDELGEARGNFVGCVVIAARLYFTEHEMELLPLAKIYDIYVREMKIILSEHQLCKQVVCHGNTIIGIYSIGVEGYMNELLDVAGRVITLPDVINAKLGRSNAPVIGNVCGMDRGMQFAIVNDGVDYFGGLLNKVEGWIMKPRGENELRGLYISREVLDSLKEQYQGFFKDSEIDNVLLGKIENIGMARWVKEQ